MRLNSLLAMLLLLVSAAAGCGDDEAYDDRPDAGPDTADAADDTRDILQQLSDLPGVTVSEWIPPADFPAAEGYRFFDLWFTQALDHDDPAAGTFQQYAALMHRQRAAPLVVYTSGYNAGWLRWRTEPTQLLDANQLSLEYRFYGSSRPAVIPWPLLRIDQAAADEHEILTALSGIYSGATIGTGGSKGGEHALQYAQLYPEDMDGVVAYVAPVMTDFPDLRYAGVLDTIGDPACRQAVRAVARRTLERRDAMVAMATMVASFDVAGATHAVETAIVELEFSYWMTRGEADCAEVPDAASASDADLYVFLDATVGAAAYADDALALFGTQYLYQDHVELGYPVWDHAYLDDLMTFSYEDWSAYLPAGEPIDYDPTRARALAAWVEQDAERILLVSGEWDPWSPAIPPVEPGRDAYSLWVHHGSHWSSGIYSLDAADAQLAIETIVRWAGVSASRQRLLAAPPAPMASRGPGSPRYR